MCCRNRKMCFVQWWLKNTVNGIPLHNGELDSYNGQFKYSMQIHVFSSWQYN